MSDNNKPFSSGFIAETKNTLPLTKEDIRLDQIIPPDIFKDKTRLKNFLESYYEFNNIDEFLFTKDDTFQDIVLNNIARFRIPDPNNDVTRFFTDETGASSTITFTDAEGKTRKVIPLARGEDEFDITISNGNDLPGSLANSTSELGKTFTLTNLNAATTQLLDGTEEQTNVDLNTVNLTLTTPITNFVNSGPSYVLNEIERNLDIDSNDSEYLDMMQKEIAPIVPRNVLVEKRGLYKQIIDFYKLRGSDDSIDVFFRILFNDEAQIEFPINKTLIPSSGNFDASQGRYLDNKGFLSDNIKIHDSDRFQKFSYVVKSGVNINDYELVYKRLIHPAGFKFFGEILLLLEGIDITQFNTSLIEPASLATPLHRKTLGVDSEGFARLVKSAMPPSQEGVVGVEDIPVPVHAFASSFTPNIVARVGKAARFSPVLNASGAITGVEIIDPGFGYISAPTITVAGEHSSGTNHPTITCSLEAGSGPRSIDLDSIVINNSAGSIKNYNNVTLSASNPVDGSSNSVVSKVMALELSGLYAKEFVSAPTFTIDAPTRKNASGVLDGTTAAGTISLNASNKIASVAISNNGDGYLVDSPTIRFTTGAQNELRTEQNRKHIKHIELNHVEVDQIVTAVNTQTSNAAVNNILTKDETSGKLIQLLSSGNPVTSTKVPAPHEIKIINNSYGINAENGYQERKGSFFDTQRLYNSGQTIEFLGTNTIESIDTTVINKYNTRTNVNIA